MDLDSSVTKWIVHLEQGDEEAARVIWEKFFARASALAMKKLATVKQRSVDNEDVALSAMNALCSGIRERRFSKIENRDDLWQILAMITSRKAIDVKRRVGRRREIGESEFSEQALARNEIDAATAQQDYRFVDNLSLAAEELLLKLDDKLQSVALLKLEGFTNREIADRQKRSIATIERYLKMIRLRWQST